MRERHKLQPVGRLVAGPCNPPAYLEPRKLLKFHAQHYLNYSDFYAARVQTNLQKR